jgi:catechol 2,3-dioxygenase-like lactoylglutathione lyase family enzyme
MDINSTKKIMKQRYINGIQQVGIGVQDANTAFKYYKALLGMDILVFEDAATAALMQRYTGNTAQQRYAMLAMNLQGGGGLEVWQYTSRTPVAPMAPVQLGDLGIFAIKIKCNDIVAAHHQLTAGCKVSPITQHPCGKPHFFLEDAWGNCFEVVAEGPLFSPGNHVTAGVAGAVIGVSNMERSLAFYKTVLGYTEILTSGEGQFADWQQVNGGKHHFKRVLLGCNKNTTGAFGHLLGNTSIELVQVTDRQAVKIYENRFWGDLGFIHLCFDINGMEAHEKICATAGHPLTVNSRNSFDMGEAAGHFAYNEDPDGTLIEYVETHKVPIAKKWGWYLNLAHRNPEKPLPNWMVKCLRFSRVK